MNERKLISASFGAFSTLRLSKLEILLEKSSKANSQKIKKLFGHIKAPYK